MGERFNLNFENLPDSTPLSNLVTKGFITDSGAGQTVAEELDPNTYYFVQDEKLLFNFESIVVALDTILRGIILSPGRFETQKGSYTVEFINPLQFLNETVQDEFHFFMFLGVKSADGLQQSIGGGIQISWDTNLGFTVRNFFIGAVDGFTFSNLVNASDFDLGPINELKVEFEDDDLSLILNGVKTLSGTFPFNQGYSTVLISQCYSVKNSILTNRPVICQIQGVDVVRPTDTSTPEVLEQYLEPPIDGLHAYYFPIKDLMRDKKLQQLSPSTYRFLEDVDVQVKRLGAKAVTAKQGDIIRALRPLLPNSNLSVCKFEYANY